MKRLVLALLLLAAALPASANASRLATDAERPALATASGVALNCLYAAVSAEDPAWAAASTNFETAGCPQTYESKVLHRDAAGTWTVAATLPVIGPCPVAGVPLQVAVDLLLCVIEPSSAQALADELLTEQLGAKWTSSSKPWVRCPAAYLLDGTRGEGPWADCEFDAPGAGGKVLAGTFRVMGTAGGVQLARLKTRAFARAPRACPIASTTGTLANRVVLTKRKLLAGGAFACNKIVAARSVSGTIDALAAKQYPNAIPATVTVNVPGFATKGFEDRYRLTCRNTRSGLKYTSACANKIGDKVTYTFTLTQKPKPKPPTSGGGNGGSGSDCHPSYVGACLKQNAGDYDCAGGSGDGPNYTGPVTVVGPDEFDLDRDGDGSACEG